MSDKTLLIGINLGDYGSTGTIMRNCFEYAIEHGNYEYLVIVPTSKGKPNTYEFAYKRNIIQKIIDRFVLLGRLKPDGFKSYFFTKRIINKILEEKTKYKKCIVHLHNIHHSDINIEVLFKALSKMNIKIAFTLHDSWAYTGGCYYYNYVQCFKWKEGCKCNCPQSLGNKFYSTENNYLKKEKAFKYIKNNTTLITVSNWLANEVNQSYLKDFKKKTIYGETLIKKTSEIDLNLKKDLGLMDKKILLTISAYWNEWKGTKYIYEVAKKLPNDYVLLVVGGKFDCKGYTNIKHVGMVKNDQLNHYYSIADVYISTSQNESLGLTTCEAQICGIPVVAFGNTGVKETISETSGYVVGDDNNVDRLIEKVIDVCEKHPFKKEDIIKNGMRFAKYEHAKKVFEIYESLSKDNL